MSVASKNSLSTEKRLPLPLEDVKPQEISRKPTHSVLCPIIVPGTIFYCVWNCFSWDWLRPRQDTETPLHTLILASYMAASLEPALQACLGEPSSCSPATLPTMWSWTRRALVCYPHRLKKPRECVSVCRLDASNVKLVRKHKRPGSHSSMQRKGRSW